MIVEIECDKINDWDSFHTYFKEKFGFPDFYGRNMNAWIDCMSYLDEDDGMSKIKISPHDTLVLCLKNVKAFKNENMDIFETLVDCSAFVNYRNIEAGSKAVILLAYYE